MGITKDFNGKKVTPLLITFITLVIFNFARIFCNKYCLQTGWYRSILYDNLHHYQLGIAILLLSFLLLKNRKRLREILIALGVGMIIDESMYLLPPLGLTNFTHNRIEGTMFVFIVFFIYAYLYLFFKRVSDNKRVD
jgi:hypothetical protein